MRLVSLALLGAAAWGQVPISIGPAHDSTTPNDGIIKMFHWYDGTPQGCVAGSGFCVGHTPQGDFYYWSAWLPNASGLPVTTGLPIVGTFNDGHAGSCVGNIGVLQLDAWSFDAPNASHISVVNCMASYSEAENSATRLWQWNNYSSDPNASVGNNSWKSRAPFSKGGLLYLPVERQIHAGGPSIHDATIIVSPDSGAHWCNPYTLYHIGTNPGTCNSSKWQANGDAPICGASAPSGACTSVQYTDSTHSAMMWQQFAAGVGGENWAFINPGNQDGTAYPAGMTGMFDPATNTCFMLMPGDGAVGCAPNASVLDISTWKYYSCPTYTQSTRCDPADSANWSSTFANRTPALFLSYTGIPIGGWVMNPYTLMFVKEFNSYFMVGVNNSAAWAPTPIGPWTQMYLSMDSSFGANMLAPALGYTVISTNPPHVQIGAVANTYAGGEGSPTFGLWDLVVGRQFNGEAIQQNRGWQFISGHGWQFSDGHMPGSFPRRGLVHTFDLSELGATVFGDWPSFRDVSNHAAVLTPCDGLASVGVPCGGVNNAHGTSFDLPAGIKVADTNENYSGHFKISPADTKLGQNVSLPGLEGNSSYSVVGVFRLDGFTAFDRPGGIWMYGTVSGSDNTSIGLDQVNGHVLVNWNGLGNPHYQFISNFTFTPGQWYFMALTITAQTGCGANCTPTAHLWVGGVSTGGLLVDALAGVTYTNTPSHNAATKTPAVSAGPFLIGINQNFTNGWQSSMTYGPLMIYSRALNYSEIQLTFRSMNAKMISRGVTLSARSDLPATTTNTQAVVSYTAPDAGACTWVVSESPSYSPLVHDVDSSLFAGANSDGGGAVSRNFVIGKRLYGTALDAKIYSRSLQADTTHYYQRTCGAQVTSGSFVTKNIPVNATYQDIPQLDPSTPGSTVTPTISATDRTQTIIDPHTGALLKRVTLPSDTNYYESGGNAQRSGSFLNFSGAPRVCGTNPVGPANGYLCSFPQGDGGPDVFYYIIPSTGESRFLGWGGVGPMNAGDSKFYSQSGDNLSVVTYTGNYANKTPEYSFNGDTASSTLLTGLTAAISAFDPTYDTQFPCFLQTAVGDFIHLLCPRGAQDSNAYIGSLRISTASVVALTRVDSNARTRGCAVHQIVPMGFTEPMMQMIPHGYTGTGVGQGPYVTSLTATISPTDTTVHVSGEPACVSCGPDTSVPPARVGDWFQIGSEVVQITVKVSPTQWTITRAQKGSIAASHTSGATPTIYCDGTLIFWKFLDDPHGTDATNTSWVQDFEWNAVAGHNDATTGQMISEAGDGWVTRAGDLLTQVGQPPTALITSAAGFAGAAANCYGNACRKHPSVGPPSSDWMSDFQLWDFAGTKNGLPTMTNISGQLYRLIDTVGSGLNPKQLAIAAAVGANYQGSGNPHALLDVSGPSCSIGTTSADNYKVGIVNAANECRAGSVKGEVYLNVPGSPGLTCDGGTQVCVANFSSLANGAVQLSVDGTKRRVITGGLTGLRKTNDYPTAKTLADGSYLLFAYGDIQRYPPSQILMAKLPPFTVNDGVVRSTFARAPVLVTAPAGLGIQTAAIEFGYLEFGAVAQHYCTSRAEACVATSSTVTDSDPFHFQTTDTYTRAACAASCTITLPVLPGHIAYYQVKFYGAGGAFVQNGAAGLAVEGAVK